MRKFKYKTIPSSVATWFTGTVGYDGGHPVYGRHQLTAQQIKNAPADFKNKLFKNIKDVYENDDTFADQIDAKFNQMGENVAPDMTESGTSDELNKVAQLISGIDSLYSMRSALEGAGYTVEYSDIGRGDIIRLSTKKNPRKSIAIAGKNLVQRGTNDVAVGNYVVGYLGESKKMKTLTDLLESNKHLFENDMDYSKDEKRSFMESVRQYKEFGNSIYRTGQIKDAVENIERMVEMAEKMTLKETEGWFDGVTTTRHIKQMKEAVKVMKKEAGEIMQRQQRLEAAYEDVGQLLGKYYEV